MYIYTKNTVVYPFCSPRNTHFYFGWACLEVSWQTKHTLNSPFIRFLSGFRFGRRYPERAVGAVEEMIAIAIHYPSNAKRSECSFLYHTISCFSSISISAFLSYKLINSEREIYCWSFILLKYAVLRSVLFLVLSYRCIQNAQKNLYIYF